MVLLVFICNIGIIDLMVQKLLKSRLLIFFIWFLVIFLLRWQWGWHWLAFILGGGLGLLLVDLDHLIYVLLVYPHESDSLKIKNLLIQKKWRQGYEALLASRPIRIKLAFRNIFFQAIFLIFCFWLLTSTISWLGRGLVMAFELQLLRENLLFSFQGKDEFLNQRLFWVLKQRPSFKTQKLLLTIIVMAFVGLSWLLI